MKPKARVAVTKGKGKQPYRFTIQAGNNEVIAPSEGYITKQSCMKRARWWQGILMHFYGPGTVELVDKTRPMK